MTSFDLPIARSKTLGVFSLAMMNVIAVDSLRSLPVGASYGLSLIFLYALAGLCFFIPIALITAELATAWPNTGGAYVWIRTAFGQRYGFFAIWLQWIYNVVWYPSILSFIAVTIAYLFNPSLATHKVFILSLVLGTWWLVIGLNSLGLRVTSWINNFGALIGTAIPMIIITVMGIIWLFNHHASTLHFSLKNLLPQHVDFQNIAYFTTIIFGLMGLEMSAVHAGDVKKPERDYPRALFWSVLFIFSSLIFASLSIAIVVPSKQLSPLTGLTDAYLIFLNQYHLEHWINVLIILIALGSFCSVSTWSIGPTRGLLVAAYESQLSNTRWLLRINKRGAPITLLLFQGMLVTLLCSLFLLLPSVNAAYWLLSVMTAQLSLIFYLFLFSAAIRLRYRKNHVARAYRIPGGKIGLWIVVCLGCLSCLFTFFVGFFPVQFIKSQKIWLFETLLISGIVLFCLPPFLLLKIGAVDNSPNE